jgi:nucleotide-binding universal stress UspA family protein
MDKASQHEQGSHPAAEGLGMRTILTHVTEGEPAALAAAVALARDLGATVYGLGAEMVPPLGVADPVGLTQAEWFEAMAGAVDRNLVKAAADFRTAAADLPSLWTSVQAPPAEMLACAARAADLIVMAAPRAADDYRYADPGEVILHAGRPVLVVPRHGRPLSGSAAVVAWRDTREARRALADALPLLVRAEKVLVVEVCGGGQKAEAEDRTADVAAALRRHGIEAQARVVHAPSENAAAELEAAAAGVGADLIVAGAYGHSRLGEWVFGGVTRDLLKRADCYLLMSH